MKPKRIYNRMVVVMFKTKLSAIDSLFTSLSELTKS